jgi:MoxR-like ATPase
MMNDANNSRASAALLDQAEALAARLAQIRAEIGRHIFGQQKVIDDALVTILSGGHGLLVGVPGLAKTRLVETLGIVLGLGTKRVQFTPDLMPADILGSEVLEEAENGRRSFRFIKGPVFCQLLMADEINRASPRTQSALLQAMQEAEVTIAGSAHPLPRPFHVLATQNPIEQEGTYPLPEAQLDRFLLQIDVDYPDRAAERRMMIETTGKAAAPAAPIVNTDELMAAQNLVRQLPVGERIVDIILDLVRRLRPGAADAVPAAANLAWGPGPRAAQALMLAVRARALLDGRLSPSLDDVAIMAPSVLRHRIALKYDAVQAHWQIEDVIKQMVSDLS